MFDGGDYKLLAWEARDVIELTKYRDRSAAELWDHRLLALSPRTSLSRYPFISFKTMVIRRTKAHE